jgi:hypothetical protein
LKKRRGRGVGLKKRRGRGVGLKKRRGRGAGKPKGLLPMRRPRQASTQTFQSPACILAKNIADSEVLNEVSQRGMFGRVKRQLRPSITGVTHAYR